MASQKKKLLKSAFVLGLESQKFQKFLDSQEYFQSYIETEKLVIYTSTQLALFIPQGIPKDHSMREQYFIDLNFYFELEYQSLSRIFILIDLDEKDIANEIINCYTNRFMNYTNYLTLIILDNKSSEKKKQIKYIHEFKDIIVCAQTQDVSIQILNSCQIIQKPLEIQINKLCSYKSRKTKKYIEYIIAKDHNPTIFSQEDIKRLTLTQQIRDEKFKRQLSPQFQGYQAQQENQKVQNIQIQGSIWKSLRDMFCFSN
ncbi:hypothetical protein pb186bvf_014244 [Paramecium bursaria]